MSSSNNSTGAGSGDGSPASAKKPTPSWVKPLIAGAVTGAIESLVTYPTEFVKTNLQLQDKKNPKYKGMWDCCRSTVQEHGLLGLYRGLTPLLVGSIPKQASRWGMYESACDAAVALRRRFADSSSPPVTRKHLTLLEVSVCGFAAGSAEAIVAVIPTETVKTRLIEDQRLAHPRFQRMHLGEVLTTLVREEGFGAVYRGVQNTVMKQGINQSVRFPVQLAVMNVLCLRAPERRKHPFWNGLGGFVAGLFSVAVTQPFDVVKTRMQGSGRTQYKGSFDCWSTIARSEGLSAFYVGTLARGVRVGMNVALTFTLFPMVKLLL